MQAAPMNARREVVGVFFCGAFILSIHVAGDEYRDPDLLESE
jgi:hypothetical protein